MSENSSLSSYPWLRSGLGAFSSPGNGTVRRKRVVTARLVDESGSLLHEPSQTFVLKGPGEVAGSTFAVRTDPTNGENDFEPNYYPHIEFLNDPDFPWRYSLDDDANGRVKPWIVLIVLKRDEFETGPNNNVKLPSILVKKEGRNIPLPDLAQSWAWAHVQITGNLPEDVDLSEYIAENPGLHVSRIMCPKRLESLTLYSAFLVPAYEMGRLAGLGMPVQETTEASWKQDMQEIELPVYYRWDFQTSEPGDFEKLVDSINFIELPAGVGIRTIDGSRPGVLKDADGNDRVYPDDEFLLEGALVPPGFSRESITSGGFTADIRPVLNRALEEAPVHDDDTVDPLVTLPVYGRHFQRTEEILSPNAAGEWNIPSAWIHEVNLDRRFRVPASFGTIVVQINQEEYMKECWEQVGDITEANEKLRCCASGQITSASLKERHIEPLEDERFVLMTQPFHHYYSHDDGRGPKSFKAKFRSSGLSPGSLSYTFKRILSQKVGFKEAKLFGPWEFVVENKRLWRRILRILFFFLRLFVQWLISVFSQNPQLQRFVPCLVKILTWLKVPAPDERPRMPDRDDTIQKGLKDELGIEMRLPDISPIKSEIITAYPIDIANSFRPRFNMKSDLLERVNKMISVPWIQQLTGFDPIMKAPTIDLSMYTHLSEKSVDLMVPGFEKLERNSSVLMEENRKFIETYLVGLSHEMGRELVWREFPTDMRGTVFHYFWDPAIAENPPRDISDIHTWSDELGAHGSGVDSEEAKLVLVIKADLIRRYPDTIFFTVKRKVDKEWEDIFQKIDDDDPNGSDGIMHLANGQAKAKDDSFFVFPPVFSASIGVDVLFLGFPFSKQDIEDDAQYDYDYSFVIMQNPSSTMRFGKDAGTGNAGNVDLQGSWDNLSWDHAKIDDQSGWANSEELRDDVVNAPAAPTWGADSASTAWITLQKPVRIIVPSEKFLKPNQEI